MMLVNQWMELTLRSVSGFQGPDVKSKLLCEAESQGQAVAVTRGADSVESADETGRVEWR